MCESVRISMCAFCESVKMIACVQVSEYKMIIIQVFTSRHIHVHVSCVDHQI